MRPLVGLADGLPCSCSICLSDYVIGELVVALPCACVFHATCIREALTRSTACPLCRVDVAAALDQS